MGSMLRRCNNWDYRKRGIYMITLTVEGRVQLLGRLSGGEAAATIVPTTVGEMVADCWREIPARYPGVTLMEYQVMPDHFHGIVFVKEPQAKPLGAMVGAFKSHSASLFKAAHATAEPKSPPHAARGTVQNRGMAQNPAQSGLNSASSVQWRAVYGPGAACSSSPVLWSPGFQDTILFRKGQLAAMRAYVLDNPRRLAVKRAHPELFRIVREMHCCGIRFAAIGNSFLLDRPVKKRIQCSRSLPPDALTSQEADLLTEARHGAVLVSPCISFGEKRIARSALASKLPLIVLLENGFAPIYKPPKTYFAACADGHLLMLAPWPYHSEKRPITREQCLALNRITRIIAGE